MITQLNDFIFCPRSIFFAGVYRESVADDLYHQTPQREGLIHHEAIDENKYSSRKDIITGLTDARRRKSGKFYDTLFVS